MRGRQDIVPSLKLDYYSYLLLLFLQQSHYEGGGTGLLLQYSQLYNNVRHIIGGVATRCRFLR